MSPYKNIRRQRKVSRLWMRSKRAGKPFINPFKGMEKVCTEKVKRKPRMLPLASRNGRKQGTWLGKPPGHKRPPKRKSTFRGGV